MWFSSSATDGSMTLNLGIDNKKCCSAEGKGGDKSLRMPVNHDADKSNY